MLKRATCTLFILSQKRLNPFPHDKILDKTKLKAFADDKLKMIISVFDRAENIVGKGEIACTSNFSFSHNFFEKASFPDAPEGVIVWECVNASLWFMKPCKSSHNYRSIKSILSTNRLNHEVEWSFEM